MAEGSGESSRYSDTLSRKTTNYAIRLNDGTVIRVSSTQYTAMSLIVGMFYSMVAVLLLAILLSLFLAARVSRSVTEPINRIDLESPDERDVYPELQPLVRRINGQNRQIQRPNERAEIGTRQTGCHAAGSLPPTCPMNSRRL